MRQARRTKFGHRTKKLYGNKRTCGYEQWLARVWADSRLAGAPGRERHLPDLQSPAARCREAGARSARRSL